MRSSACFWLLWVCQCNVLANSDAIRYLRAKRTDCNSTATELAAQVTDNFFQRYDLPGFTNCFKVKFSSSNELSATSFRGDNQVIKNTYLQIEVTNQEKLFILHNGRIFEKNLPGTDKATLCCVSWTRATKTFRMYFDGIETLTGIGVLTIHWAFPKDALKDSSRDESLSGKITEVKRWKHPLTDEEIKQVQQGKPPAIDTRRLFFSWKLFVDKIMKPEFELPETTTQTTTQTTTETTTQITTQTTAHSSTESTTVGQPTTTIKNCAHPTASVLDLIPLDLSDRNPALVETSIKFPQPLTKKFEELSVCAWVYYRSIEDLPVSLLRYNAVNDVWTLSFHIWKDQTHYGWNNLIELISAPLIEAGKWHHICFTWSDIRNATVDIYHDGSLALHRQVTKGAVRIGKEINFDNYQYAPFDPRNPTKGFVAKITGINMWDYPLTPVEVFQSYTCPPQHPGNFISWEKSGKAYNPIV